MGNSTSLGHGGSEARDIRDMEGDEFKDGRPPKIAKLAEENPIQEEPSNPNPPQWCPSMGLEGEHRKDEVRNERTTFRARIQILHSSAQNVGPKIFLPIE